MPQLHLSCVCICSKVYNIIHKLEMSEEGKKLVQWRRITGEKFLDLNLESGEEYRSATALQIIIMVLTFFLNEARNNWRLFSEECFELIYIDYCDDSRLWGGWQVCKWRLVRRLMWWPNWDKRGSQGNGWAMGW